jgi:subtilase-type serine protease
VRASRIEVGAPASAEPEGTGEITLNGGRVTADETLTIWENGTLGGSGEVVGALVNHGTINVGLEPLAPDDNLRARAASDARPGVLTVGGSASFAPGSTLRLDLVGSEQYDQLTLNGTAQLGGNLVLAFSKGYAPRAGDSFQFVSAASSSGEFAAVTVTGLAPGWRYTLSSSGGVTTLRSNSDAVPTTAPTLLRRYLPVIHR